MIILSPAQRRAEKVRCMVEIMGPPIFNPDAWGRLAFATQEEMDSFLNCPFDKRKETELAIRKKISSRYQNAKAKIKTRSKGVAV